MFNTRQRLGSSHGQRGKPRGSWSPTSSSGLCGRSEHKCWGAIKTPTLLLAFLMRKHWESYKDFGFTCTSTRSHPTGLTQLS